MRYWDSFCLTGDAGAGAASVRDVPAASKDSSRMFFIVEGKIEVLVMYADGGDDACGLSTCHSEAVREGKLGVGVSRRRGYSKRENAVLNE